MRRIYAVTAAVLLALGVWWWWSGSGRGGGAREMSADARAAAPAVMGAAAAPAAADAGPRVARPTAEARAQTDALRQRIVQRVGPRGGGAAAAPAASGGGAPVERPPGNLIDRTGGGRDAMLKRLNHDFMPLADECIEQAQERTPALAGMLAINLEIVADEELGAVVEVADPAPRNEVAEPGLLECMRESALSLSLPPPDGSGRDAVMLTLPISPR